MLADKDAEVRRAALGGLLALGKDAKPALAELLKLVNDDDEKVRRYLAEILADTGPEGQATLTKLLEDKSADVRGLAADSLGHMGPAAKDAADALKRHLGDMGRLSAGIGEPP